MPSVSPPATGATRSTSTSSRRLASSCSVSSCSRRPPSTGGHGALVATQRTRRGRNGVPGAGKATSDQAQQVPELLTLRAQVVPAAVGGRDLERHALGDLEAVSGESGVLAGVVGEQAQPAHSEVAEDGGADPVLALVGAEAEPLVGLDRVVPALLQLVGAQLVDEADAAPLLEQVEQHAAPLLLDALEREVELHPTVAALRAEDVAGDALAVHAHQHRLVGAERRFARAALHQRQVLLAGRGAAVAVQAHLAVG